MASQSTPQFPIVKGVVASNSPLAQPKGSIARGFNLLMTARGGLNVTDGSGVINAFGGVIQTVSGKITCVKLFTPTGVAPYYLVIKITTTEALVSPANLTAADAGAGGLGAGTYFYKVTAIDGAGGETTASNEVSQTIAANHRILLTWNVVPNAFGYNIYRSNTTNTETIMVGSDLPVLQPGAGNLTQTFIDSGQDTVAPAVNISSVLITGFRLPTVPLATFTLGVGFTTAGLTVGTLFTPTGITPSKFNRQWHVTGITGTGTFTASAVATIGTFQVGDIGTGGTFTIAPQPPGVNTTTQTALYKMPTDQVSYDDSNIVALWPATIPSLNTPPSGGSGGGGTTGNTSFGNQQSTVNGGIQGMVSLAPLMKQFTNRMAIALGNGFAPQYYSDPTGTPTNPALTGAISTVTVDAFGVVTVTTAAPHGLAAGSNVILAGILNTIYDGTFVIINVPGATSFKVVNVPAIGAGASSGGTWTQTTSPISSSFTPAYPEWTSASVLNAGDLIVPATQPAEAIYLTVIQGGTTGSVEPTWPTGGTASIGQHVDDGTVVYSVAGLLNSGAPPPPGCAHMEVFSGALWVFNTWFENTADGLDGPSSLRQSSINNMLSWNPVNQAFLDKDDGTEGMGLAKFTITAQGIPPEGSLIAFKNYSPYQIIGVFGAVNLSIQAVSSDMGCIDPRSIVFVPGFGIMRYSHLGFANFNGVKDEVQSEQIRPYLFPDTQRNFSDITVVDANWVPVGVAGLTANPPMYCCAMPIGDSGGQLTRLFCFDLVLKAWVIVDLPFSISWMSQERSVVSNPITVFGGYTDGALQRWQAGDLQWYTNSSSNFDVSWSMDTNQVASQQTDQRVYCRRLVVTGTNSGGYGSIAVEVFKDGVSQFKQTFIVAPDADFDIDMAVGLTGKRFNAQVSSVGGETGGGGTPSNPFALPTDVELDGCTWESEARPAGVVISI